MPQASLWTDIITQGDALRAQDDAWAELWRDSDATPFQSPAWAIPWWETYGVGQLQVVTCREGRDLVAIAPFFVRGARPAGGCALQVIGTGNTDYLDVVIRRGFEAAALDALSAAVADRLGWSIADFRCLRPEAHLHLLSCPGASEQRYAEPACPVVDLDRPIPHGVARTIARSRHRIEADGGLTTHIATPATVEADLAVLFALHEKRWKNREQAGVLDPTARRFHTIVAPRFERAGLLQLITIGAGGSPIAVYYGLLHAGRAYAYLGGFDPLFVRYSPGTLALAAAVEEARAAGAHRLDFLGGREAYKYAWGAVDEPRGRRVLHRSLEERHAIEAKHPDGIQHHADG